MTMTSWFCIQVCLGDLLYFIFTNLALCILGSGARKFGEYGGNTLGYGSKSVLGSGWPNDTIKVDGDMLTISFEMRSGREHNTPDKVIWGFRVSVRAQEQEDTSSISPCTADLALTLSTLLHSYIQVKLYQC